MSDSKDIELRKRNIRLLIVLLLIAAAFYGGFIAMTAFNKG
jgi:uncharacterized membrane protein (DUF485 family)